VFLWFVGPTVALVWLVFRSPAFDYRVVVLGALLPLVEVVFGGPGILHTLLGAVAGLTIVMAATRRRRLVRRRWIGLPVGLLFHLGLDGAFTRAELFWWPFLGSTWPDGGLPELDRPFVVLVVLEALGATACWWCYRAFGLDDPARRKLMVETGQVDRSMLPPT